MRYSSWWFHAARTSDTSCAAHLRLYRAGPRGRTGAAFWGKTRRRARSDRVWRGAGVRGYHLVWALWGGAGSVPQQSETDPAHSRVKPTQQTPANASARQSRCWLQHFHSNTTSPDTTPPAILPPSGKCNPTTEAFPVPQVSRGEGQSSGCPHGPHSFPWMEAGGRTSNKTSTRERRVLLTRQSDQ